MDAQLEELDGGPEFFAQDGPSLFADPPVSSPVSTDAPLALYRRYRPEVFGEVIGQEHVTTPLKRALSNNRVTHAYLFSGPRGCGKTSSARILARSLNCEKGPTPEPCGVCHSCTDLARGGPGSIDVLEIDAASHGGVDDARDLRERAFYAPVRSRYRVYIVDEAHMVTSAGFNALLKLVEEPPPHVKFIFATTEPDKVIGTIRSRTHHYPFRLIPPKTMTTFLTQICEEEGVSVESGVIPMVVRAGSGSVRDALSVLDQLIGGSPDSGVGYDHAAALLGYTPDSLLDGVVDAIAAGDSAEVFANVDRVIEAGQDPRRFTEDLLTRFRDLVIVAAVPDALSTGLLDVPDDQGERYRHQAKEIGIGSLTRAAEVLAAGLVGMRGTTAPRLQLELMCARILLPAADAGERGIIARLEKLEKGFTPSGPVREAPVPPEPAPPVRSVPQSLREASQPAADPQPPKAPPKSAEPKSAEPKPVVEDPPSPPKPATPPTDLSTEWIRQAWPRILSRTSEIRRYVWMILNQYTKDLEIRERVLWVTFTDAGPRDNFNRSGGDDCLAQAISTEMGATIQIRARLESEAIPDEGTAILSLATSSEGVQPMAGSGHKAPALAVVPNPPDASGDAPSDDDDIVENPIDEASELVIEMFDAELVSEESRKKS
ncbi:MAG: DNA polymerase III subunit gamma and tau [Propionibacteriaceae bacterium]|jgi:DNA polymerase-3 subunit gamma/tau|nr:DNA polymerase III subunit gamma and tau [Propionibacteriaceae bacterium]